METEIKNLIKLARKFLKFSEKKYGWDTRYYLNYKVMCYFSEHDEHTSVHIDWAFIQFFPVIEIGFVNPKNITSEKISELVKKYSDKLKKLK